MTLIGSGSGSKPLEAAASPFCLGAGSRGWKADIDWFLRPDTVTRIMEGKYDPKPGESAEKHAAETPATNHRRATTMNGEILDREPPNSPEAEKGVLGSIICDAKVVDQVAEILRPEDFYSDAGRHFLPIFLI